MWLAIGVLGSLLSPPSTLSQPADGGVTQLSVGVREGLSITLLEADAAVQEQLVDAALEADTAGAAEDPYGTVLWPVRVRIIDDDALIIIQAYCSPSCVAA